MSEKAKLVSKVLKGSIEYGLMSFSKGGKKYRKSLKGNLCLNSYKGKINLVLTESINGEDYASVIFDNSSLVELVEGIQSFTSSEGFKVALKGEQETKKDAKTRDSKAEKENKDLKSQIAEMQKQLDALTKSTKKATKPASTKDDKDMDMDDIFNSVMVENAKKTRKKK